MQLANHEEIVRAIHDRKEVMVRFRSKEDGGAVLSRRCAPMDFAPGSRAHDKTPRYHFWDFESDSEKTHTLSMLASQIIDVEALESSFDPGVFVTWAPRWTVARTSWGIYN